MNPQYTIDCIKATLNYYPETSSREDLLECISRCKKGIEDFENPVTPPQE
jgi:hypothetical protein